MEGVIEVSADRGRRQFHDADAGGGRVLHRDIRSMKLRFGAASESAARSATSTERAAVRRHIVTAVQRRLVQRAAAGQDPALADLGGLGFPAVATTATHPSPPSGSAALLQRPPLPQRRPRQRQQQHRHGSTASSQDVAGMTSSTASVGPPPSAGGGCGSAGRAPSDTGEEARWDEVLRHKLAVGSGGVPSVPEGGSGASQGGSSVRGILGACARLKSEIRRERDAASEVNGRIDGLLAADAATLRKVEEAARTDPAARRQLKKAYAALLSRQANDALNLPDLTPTPNPVIPLIAGHSTRRHYREHYKNNGGATLLHEG